MSTFLYAIKINEETSQATLDNQFLQGDDYYYALKPFLKMPRPNTYNSINFPYKAKQISQIIEYLLRERRMNMTSPDENYSS